MPSHAAFSSSTATLTGSKWGCYNTAQRRCARRAAPRVVRTTTTMSVAGKKVLVIGGTRFAGLYLVHALHGAGAAEVTLLNRGSRQPDDPALAVPGEDAAVFRARAAKTRLLVADRSDEAALLGALGGSTFDVVYDNNGRELADSRALIDATAAMGAHYVYMSSAGVYAKSDVMPHIEGDAVDLKCRHKGKLDTEQYMAGKSGLKWTAFRPTYIYGAGNYNPLEQYFFERVDSGRPVCVPGHGMHLTGLGHVRDLAAAMSAAGDEDKCFGQVYNVQDEVAVSFDGVAKLCAKIAGRDVDIVHYDPKDFDFGKKKAFPFRPQHFFTSPAKALRELDWEVRYGLEEGLRDAYENDFLVKKREGKLKNDFTVDEIVLDKVKNAAAV